MTEPRRPADGHDRDIVERTDRIMRALDFVCAEIGCTRTEAIARLSRLAVETDETLAFVAACVLDGSVVFDIAT